MIVLDNFKSYHLKLVAEIAECEACIHPPYSPDLNPIEFIWKSVKRIVSVASINSEEDLKVRIRNDFLEVSASLTFARSWNRNFLDSSIIL
ncbi:MAG: transposase [Nitrososphaeria archaeon]